MRQSYYGDETPISEEWLRSLDFVRTPAQGTEGAIEIWEKGKVSIYRYLHEGAPWCVNQWDLNRGGPEDLKTIGKVRMLATILRVHLGEGDKLRVQCLQLLRQMNLEPPGEGIYDLGWDHLCEWHEGLQKRYDRFLDEGNVSNL